MQINHKSHQLFIDELKKFGGTQSLLLGDLKANKIDIEVTGSLPTVKWYKMSGTEKRLLVSYEDDLQKQVFGE